MNNDTLASVTGAGPALSGDTAGIIAVTAQQAVLPRRLEDGQVYAILDAEGGIQIVETPGYTSERKEADLPGPSQIARSTVTLDTASFLDYIAENTEKETANYVHGQGSLEVWADVEESTITAVLDGYDGWRQHTTTLKLSTTNEWNEWLAIDGNMLDQEQFAEFIEDHLSTIAEPDGAKLVEICQTMTGYTNQKWRSQKILANGQRQFQWEEAVDAKAGDKGDLTIPSKLVLVLRPYWDSPSVAMEARFRFRLRAGELQIGVKLNEPHQALDGSFDEIIGDINENIPSSITVRCGRL